MQQRRIHLTGASGSGTSTLGRSLAARVGCPVFDADDYYWVPTRPPFTTKRAPADRWSLLCTALHDAGSSWVLSGSAVGWAADLDRLFTLIVFLEAPTAVRVERLRRRELDAYGHVDEDFLDWAARYDSGDESMRSRARHETWLRQQTCPVLRLDSTRSTDVLAGAVLRAVEHP